MIDIISQMFSHAFLVRAMVVGLLVSLCAAVLGISLVLKRYSMIGDGLSHVGFGALSIANALSAAKIWMVSPVAFTTPIVMLAAVLLLRIKESSRIKGDAAIALISTASISLGVIVVAVTTGINTDVCNVMFGSILAMRKSDVYLSIVLAVLVLVLFVLFYHKIFAVTFDETFARATGVPVGMYNMLIALLTAVVIVLGMRMMGSLLISSLIIFPALTAMRLCKRFLSVAICSAVLSATSFFIGMVLSFQFTIPTGAAIVAVSLVFFLAFCLISFIKRRVRT